jgi:hypothetical protein
MGEEEIGGLWRFEQDWLREGKGVVRHRDVFEKYIVPRLKSRIEGWDNLSLDGEVADVGSMEECETMCQGKTRCFQWSYAGGRCSTSEEIRYGNEADRLCVEYSVAASKCVRWHEGSGIVQSGWMLDRVPQYMEEMDSLCHDIEEGPWVT